MSFLAGLPRRHDARSCAAFPSAASTTVGPRPSLIVNLGDLNDAFKAGDEVTPESLVAANLVKGRYDELKILGNGELTKKLKISAHRFSKSAAEKIAAAGGEAIVLPGPAPVVKTKMKPRAKEASGEGQSTIG